MPLFDLNDPKEQEKAEQLPAFARQLQGTGNFRGSDRASSGPAESFDSLAGVPVRTGLNELASGNYNPISLASKIAGSIGTDPSKAPTGYDIASKVTDNPYLGTALATAADVAQLPIGAESKALGGIAGTVEDLAAKRRIGSVIQAMLDKQAPKAEGIFKGASVPKSYLDSGKAAIITSGPAMLHAAADEAAANAAQQVALAKKGIIWKP